MDVATPKLRAFAPRLLALEAAGTTGEAKGPSALHVCEKLRRPLSRLAGVAGFRALLARALALASAEVRWLIAVRVMSDGSLEGLGEVEVQLSADEIAQGEALLIAQLIGLLVTFIGPALTLHLVREAWPEDSFEGLGGDGGS